MGNGITIFRERLGITKTELARRTGIHKVQIGRLESGERKLTKEWATQIAPSLNCTPSELLFPKMVTNPESVTRVVGTKIKSNAALGSSATRFAEEGTPFLSASKIGKLLGISHSELESLTGIALTSEANLRNIDAALSPIVRILAMVIEMIGSEEEAPIWFKHQPIPGWAGKTAYDLVCERRADRVLAYLEAVRSGVYA